MKMTTWFRELRLARLNFSACRNLWIALACSLAVTGTGEAVGQGGPNNYDVRTTPQQASAAINQKITANRKADTIRKQMLEGKAELADKMPGLEISVDETLGIASQIANGKGVLSAPAGKPEDTVKSFVTNNYKLFGLDKSAGSQLKVRASYENPENKVQWVTLQQEIGGVPVFRAELRAGLTEKGELKAITNEFAPGLTENAVKAPPVLSAEDALIAVGNDLGVAVDSKKLIREKTSDDGNTIDFKNFDSLYHLRSSQVVFPLAPGESVLTWQIIFGWDSELFMVVVDASSGETLFRKNLKNYQTQSATYAYFDSESPNPGNPRIEPPIENLDALKPEPPGLPMVQKTLLSEYPPGNPDGWLPDFENTTRGNNVLAYRDQVAPNGIDVDPVNPALLSVAYGNGNGPSLFNRNFRFNITPAPDGGHGPTTDQTHTLYNNATVTNLFFWTNRWHDYMYRLGFTEPARNFQSQNFGRGGSPNDPVLAEALDASLQGAANNANFATPPDGLSGRMQMYVYTETADGWPTENVNPARDSGLDQNVVLHELTHGLSNRLVGNAGGLINRQGGGLGEGWSDFYATAMLAEYPENQSPEQRAARLDPDGTHAGNGWTARMMFGVNLDSYFYGDRPFPYSTKRAFSPLTYADTDPYQYGTQDVLDVVPESPVCLSQLGAITHNLGNIWSTILWEARANIMRRFEGAGFPSQTDAWFHGNRHMLQLVTDGLKLTPTSPTFLEARNAIIDAALLQQLPPAGWTSNDSANPTIAAHDEAQLWAGFASRGLGYKAVSPPRNDTATWPLEPENYWSLIRSSDPVAFPPPPPTSVLTGLEDDDSVEIPLPAPFTFYGRVHNSVFVGTNGYLTFGEEDTSSEITLKHHFSLPRISGLLCDLDGSTTAGTISVQTVGRSLLVTYRNMPESGIEPDEETNSNNFRVRIICDSPQGARGSFEIEFGNCTAPVAICGISPGPFSPEGPFYTDDEECTCGFPEADEDLSAYTVCNNDLGLAFFTEFFKGPDFDDVYDLAGVKLHFSYLFTNGWTVAPIESYETPLQAREPKFVNFSGQEAIDPGDFVFIRVPLENEFKKANLTGVLGLITPISEGVDVIDPVSDYGRIDSGKSADGNDPFIIKIADDVPCGAQIQLKVDFSSDQGVTGGSRNIYLTVGGGFGDPQGSLTWPQGKSQGVVGVAIDENATQIQLSSQLHMRGSTFLRNERTNEIIRATFYNGPAKTLTVLRGQKGTAKAPMQVDDVLMFDSVPIPDATASGVGFTVFPNDPNISGPIGRVRINLGKFTHPNIPDLRMTLSNSQGYSVLLMEGARAGFGASSVFTNITLDTSATVSIQTPAGIESGGTYRPIEDFSAFQHPAFDAASTWTLTVADLRSPFAGDMSEWSIELTPYRYCETPVIDAATFDGGTSGWQGMTYGDAGHQRSFHKAASGNAPGTLVLQTDAFDSLRVPQWRSPGVALTHYPNQVYRFNAWIVRSDQPSLSSLEQLPWMRLRAGIGDVMIHVHNYFFDNTRIDPAANQAAMTMIPSTSANNPTRYWVDLDPVDAPSLYTNPEHKVYGAVENLSYYPTHQGNFEVVESRMDRYSAPPPDEATRVWTISKPVVAGIWSGNYANTVTESDQPNGRPFVTTSSLGITIDSTRVKPGGSHSFATVDVSTHGNDIFMQPDHLYRVRYHVTSNTPSSGNPIMRFRTHSVNWIDSHELILGPSNFGLERDRQLARELLPGLGTQNPNRRADEKQGGYYDQFISGPPESITSPEMRRLRLGFDLIDLGYDGSTDPAQLNEGGRYTLDSIEVREYRQR